MPKTAKNISILIKSKTVVSLLPVDAVQPASCLSSCLGCSVTISCHNMVSILLSKIQCKKTRQIFSIFIKSKREGSLLPVDAVQPASCLSSWLSLLFYNILLQSGFYTNVKIYCLKNSLKHFHCHRQREVCSQLIHIAICILPQFLGCSATISLGLLFNTIIYISGYCIEM